MITKFFQFREERKRRQALQNIRREFANAGYALDRFRDSEVEAALTRGSSDVASVTLTPTNIYRTLRRLERFTTETSEITKPQKKEPAREHQAVLQEG